VGLEVRPPDTLCLRAADGAARCLRITLGTNGYEPRRTHARDDDIRFVERGESCVFADHALRCGARSEPAELRWAEHFGYLVSADRVRWFAPPTNPCAHDDDRPLALRTMTQPARQLSVAYRIGCAVGLDGAGSCWSDPAHPVRLAAPEPIAEVMTQDTFELCARGRSGKLYCAPPPALPDELACSMTGLRCGRSAVDDPVLHAPFDPAAWLRKPLAVVPLPFAAARLVRDEDEQYGICMDDHLHLQPSWGGGCALGAAGEVACFTPAGRTWTRYRIAGLPAVTAVWAGRGSDYGLAADGSLYTWPSASNSATAPGDVSATRLELPPIADVTPPLFIQSGPSTKDRLRCALTRAGEVRCWRADRGTPAPFDPTARRAPER
jgi:hypothetical protein